MRDKRTVMAPHTLCRMVVVIGDWHGTDAIVLGAVESSTHEAFIEENRWDEIKQEMFERSGLDELDCDRKTLKEVIVPVYMPFLWEPLDVKPEQPEALVDPEERFRAAVAGLKRRRDELEPATRQGYPNDIHKAEGEIDGLQTALDLLQRELSEPKGAG